MTDSRSARIRNTTSVLSTLIAVLSLLFCVLTYFKVAETLIRTDEVSLLKKAEAEYGAGNYSDALKLFSSSALYDSSIASAYLGYMYSNGMGTDINFVLGCQYYSKAMDAGYDSVKHNYTYNIMLHSTCYYEMADTLLSAIYSHDASALQFFNKSYAAEHSPNILAAWDQGNHILYHNRFYMFCEGKSYEEIRRGVAECLSGWIKNSGGDQYILNEESGNINYSDARVLGGIISPCINHDVCNKKIFVLDYTTKEFGNVQQIEAYYCCNLVFDYQDIFYQIEPSEFFVD